MKRKLVIYAKVKANTDLFESKNFKSLLQILDGKWIKVDTKYLFEDQLNTVDFSKKLGLRLLYKHISCIVICNGTLDNVKEQINNFYKKSWNRNINETMFKTFWKRWYDFGLPYKEKIMTHNHNKRIIEL